MDNQHAHFEKEIKIERDGCIALDALSKHVGLSKSRLKTAMQKGSVWLCSGRGTQRLRRAKKVLQKGDTLYVYYDEGILAEVPSPPELITDRESYSVWYKPYGLRSQGSKWGDHCTVHRWVEQNLKPQRPAFVVHRLDRAATGLILIAHQKRIATALAKLFESRQIEKRYRAIVHGCFPQNSDPMVMTAEIDGRSACSKAISLGYDPERDRSLLEVEIETGRKHQIRHHLSEIGYSVVGDRIYGKNEDVEDLQLSAYYLGFCCPVSGEDISFFLPEKWMLFL